MYYFQVVRKEKFDHITDTELLDKFYSDKDSYWLGIILQRYTFLLLGVCMKYLKNEESAKDAVQQIFLKALLELSKYKVTYLKSWLYMVAKNHCLMILRNKPTFIELAEKTDFLENENNKEGDLDKEVALTILETALTELNKEQKTCVTLFYLQKKSYQEIVSSTGFTLLQVKSFIQNGKRNLKLLVKKKMKSAK